MDMGKTCQIKNHLKTKAVAAWSTLSGQLVLFWKGKCIHFVTWCRAELNLKSFQSSG
jgi:hypothetical protein